VGDAIVVALGWGRDMSNQFYLAIRSCLDTGATNSGFSLGGNYGQTFSALVGGSGPSGIGYMKTILDKFQNQINSQKAALGLSKNFDWAADLPTPTITNVVTYYLGKSITTLISDTVIVLSPASVG